MIKHIVMWNVRGDDAATRARHLALLKSEFESLRGRVPGLMHLEVGVDESRIDYACDVVLYTEFDSRDSLAGYAQHPEHLRVRQVLGDLRSARHQVDYEISPVHSSEFSSASAPAPAPALAPTPAVGRGLADPPASPNDSGDKNHVHSL